MEWSVGAPEVTPTGSDGEAQKLTPITEIQRGTYELGSTSTSQGVNRKLQLSSVGLDTPVESLISGDRETRVSYAHMLIEVNVTKKLPDEVTVADPNGKVFA
ncbi:hypothetical protein FXO37_30459 [Capsicum annuum]|nr:hypothetical protein FXO37_30459 [Capsicum annuum]